VTPGRRAIAALAFILVTASACGTGDDASRLPDLDLPTVDATTSVDLGALTGPAVINLWATYCAPCRREIPDFETVHREMADTVRFIGVNIGDTPEQIADYLSGLDDPTVTYEQLVDLMADLPDALGTVTLPVTVLVDDDGTIAEVHDGPLEANELRDRLAPLVG
jgi:thiol-disulfide isomerase/thioredoxin